MPMEPARKTKALKSDLGTCLNQTEEAPTNHPLWPLHSENPRNSSKPVLDAKSGSENEKNIQVTNALVASLWINHQCPEILVATLFFFYNGASFSWYLKGTSCKQKEDRLFPVQLIQDQGQLPREKKKKKRETRAWVPVGFVRPNVDPILINPSFSRKGCPAG